MLFLKGLSGLLARHVEYGSGRAEVFGSPREIRRIGYALNVCFAHLCSIAALAAIMHTIASPAQAWAQWDERGDELPRPLFERGFDDEEEEAARAKRRSRERGGWFGIAPTLGAGYSLHFDQRQPNNAVRTGHSIPIWLGAMFYPSVQERSLFGSLSVGLDHHLSLPRSSEDYWLNMHVGLAIFESTPHDFMSVLTPWLKAYGIVGLRHVSDERFEETRVRVGLGASSPQLMLVAAYLCFSGIPLPNIIEYVVEIEPSSGQTHHLLMVGVSL
jgi:hypothetical protein